MSDIKINGNTYREEDVAFNWGVEFVKAMIDAHSEKAVIDHADGSVTLPKLAGDVTDFIGTAITGAENANTAVEKVKTDISNLETDCVNSRLVYKVYQVAAGGTFEIKPNMLCIVMPYGGKTIGVMKKDQTELISGNVGFTICFAAEINTGEYANGANHRVFFAYVPQSVLSTLTTYHNLLDVGAYFVNNGEGTMYVYALMKEVDAE